VEVLLLALFALALTGFFAVLRTALLHSVPSRVLDEARSPEERDGLRPLLERAEVLATSASIFEISFQIFFVVLVLGMIGDELSPGTMGLSLLVSVPLLVLATEVVPGLLRGERSDRLLRSALPAFDLLQRPLAAVLLGLEATRKLIMRLFRIPDRAAARRIVEGIRDVIEETDRESDLQQTEREMIENVIEFHDVDVAELMTPRTELTAVEVEEGVPAAVRAIASSGHSRIPVYQKNLDTIVGIAYAHEILQHLDATHARPEDSDRGAAALRQLIQPIGFVPETKLVSELLAEFRRDKCKMAVVLDEYGGTAGIVTMGDIVAEIVGEMREELGEPAPEPIRRRADGGVDIQGMTRVSDVNEELELELPEEEDFETLAGFVLAQLGHLPKEGESFRWNELELTVTRANDRRVLEVLLRSLQTHKLGSGAAH
jgi:CBS domain containing-hemolysin-like protein